MRGDASERRPAPEPRGHIPALDGLRGIAILLVLMIHLVAVSGGRPRTGLDVAVFRVTFAGWAGVPLFFVLSGFLITGLLHDGKSDPRRASRFYARRALRIFPLYYATLFLWLLVLPRTPGGPNGVDPGPWLGQLWYWAYAANLRSLAGGGGFQAPALLHFWSLGVEEHFYLVWPLVVWRFERVNLLRICAALILGATVSRPLLALAGWSPFDVWTLDTSHLDALGLGGFLALAARGPGGLETLVRPARLVFFASAAALAAVVYAQGGMVHVNARFQALGFPPLVALCGSGLVLAVAAPALGPVGALLQSRVLRFFGRYSYGLYVWHGLLMTRFHAAFPTAALQERLGSYTAGALAHGAIAGAISVAVAVASYHLFEAPFLRLKSRFADPASAVPTPHVRPVARSIAQRVRDARGWADRRASGGGP